MRYETVEGSIVQSLQLLLLSNPEASLDFHVYGWDYVQSFMTGFFNSIYLYPAATSWLLMKFYSASQFFSVGIVTTQVNYQMVVLNP